jgi:hypothetical protein
MFVTLNTKSDTNNIGLRLGKKQIAVLFSFELIVYIFIFLNYQSSVNLNIADDFIWHNLYSYFRGFIFLLGIQWIGNFAISSKIITLLAFPSALLFDYIILLIVSKFFKRKFKPPIAN